MVLLSRLVSQYLLTHLLLLSLYCRGGQEAQHNLLQQHIHRVRNEREGVWIMLLLSLCYIAKDLTRLTRWHNSVVTNKRTTPSFSSVYLSLLLLLLARVVEVVAVLEILVWVVD